MEKLNFYIDKKIIYVDVVRTTNRQMYLKVKDNKIVVSANKRTRKSDIHKFVADNIEKFVEYLNNIKENELYSVDEKFIYIKGEKKKFDVLTGFKECRLIIKGNVYIETTVGSDQEVEKTILDWTKSFALKYVEENQPKWEKIMEVPPHRFKTTHKSTSWGTHSYRTKTIIYNSKLSHFSDDAINYVIIHELAHYFQPNHSSDFWGVVSKYMPEHKKISKMLRADTSMGPEL